MKVRLIGFGPEWGGGAAINLLQDHGTSIFVLGQDHYVEVLVPLSNLSKFRKGKFPLGREWLPKERAFQNAYRTAMAGFVYISNTRKNERHEIPWPSFEGDESGSNAIHEIFNQAASRGKRLLAKADDDAMEKIPAVIRAGIDTFLRNKTLANMQSNNNMPVDRISKDRGMYREKVEENGEE